MNPPQHTAVFCVEEKTAIQAFDRLDPLVGHGHPGGCGVAVDRQHTHIDADGLHAPKRPWTLTPSIIRVMYFLVPVEPQLLRG